MSMKIGLVGIGKIARDQHFPALTNSTDFTLAATASRNNQIDGIAATSSLRELLDRYPDIPAVSLCTPPAGRAADARLALEKGVHVMLEKPPTATLSEAQDLIDLAQDKKVSLFFSWHSRQAPAVARARAWLEGRSIKAVRLHWLEDIRVWHPGQEWILEAGGFGVFDPGINGLSILTAILPQTFALQSGRMVFPGNRQAPISASLRFSARSGAPIDAELDFLFQGPPRWDIEVETDAGSLKLTNGGARMLIDGVEKEALADDHLLQGEYPKLYKRFAELIRAGQSDTDVSPLRHVADAFLLSQRANGPDFAF
jgi:D-galactose 1-dehydrogenase